MLTAILLTLASGALAGPSYLSDPVLQRVAKESHGTLRPVTNFSTAGHRAPLTNTHGISLYDFATSPPRKNGPKLDAFLIAMELSDHNWPLSRILTSTGGVDVDKATVALTPIDPTSGIAPRTFSVKRDRSRGSGAWWIEAWDQALAAGIKQNYGTLGDDYRQDYFPVFTGYTSYSSGSGRYPHRLWTKYVTESVRAKSPVVIFTRPASEWNGTLKPDHAYAVEAITNGPDDPNIPINPITIDTITLRDAETATKGVTYKWDDLQVDMNWFWYIIPYHDGPGEK